jgi:hypothetical protein
MLNGENDVEEIMLDEINHDEINVGTVAHGCPPGEARLLDRGKNQVPGISAER